MKKKNIENKKKYIKYFLKKHLNRKEGINYRQMKALQYLENNDELYNSLYQDLTSCDRRTASRDLTRLVELNILERYGKGRGTYYILKRKNK